MCPCACHLVFRFAVTLTANQQVVIPAVQHLVHNANVEVLMQVLTARKNKHQDSFGRSTSSGSTGGGASAPRLVPPPGSGLAAPAAHHQAQQQALSPAPMQPQQSSYLDAFTELQQVCQVSGQTHHCYQTSG